ncbi:unnamed protein product [Soboliphyme baturini]|uniref:acylaminoacyl-peptidase n=1 Tax=Soboliphyme baturini TaxID=241478 RepID=A0A183IFV4_9BILA|nr:unnamed protein product [Soboliphyme baturini]
MLFFTNCNIDSLWSQRDLTRNVNIKFSRKYLLKLADDGRPKQVISKLQPQETDELYRCTANPTGNLEAVLKRVAPTKRSADQKKPDEVDHWSEDQTKLLYVAEQFFQPIGYSNPLFEEANDGSGPEAEEFFYHESWGEQMSEVRHPVACILDISTGKIDIVNIQNVSVTETVWSPSDDGIVFIGLQEEPRKLGKMYCSNRRSSVMYFNFQRKESIEIGTPGKAVRSPIFNRSGDTLIYLETEALGAHLKSERLMNCDWKTKGVQAVTDVVSDPAGLQNFPGLFSAHLPKQCWCNDDKRVILDSAWGAKTEILVIDVSLQSVTKISNIAKVEGTWTALGVWDDYVLATFSTPVVTPTLFIARLPEAGRESEIHWMEVDRCGPRSKYDFQYSLLEFQRPPEKGENPHVNTRYEGLFTHPTQGSNWPCILWPHGGPHTVSTIAWNLESAFFMSFGYAVLRRTEFGYVPCSSSHVLLLVNYHGSTGYGENFVRCLLGNVGHTDVLDCQHALKSVLDKEPRVDRNALFLFGGSHGGFLVLHISATSGTAFKACVARNPVANIAAMVDCSDIPDWCVSEALADEVDFQHPVSAKMREVMWTKSPIAHVDKTVTPTLFMLGDKDLRVPALQCKEYIHVMKSRGIPVKVLYYPENCHPLDKVDAECDVAINCVRWLEHYKNLK